MCKSIFWLGWLSVSGRLAMERPFGAGQKVLVIKIRNFQFLRSKKGRLLVNGLADFQFGDDRHLAANAAGPGGWGGAVATDRFMGHVGCGHGRVRAQ
jgi:hypothetical protein